MTQAQVSIIRLFAHHGEQEALTEAHQHESKAQVSVKSWQAQYENRKAQEAITRSRVLHDIQIKIA